MNSETSPRWADRLGTGTRTILIVTTIIFGLFAVGMVAGFSYAVLEDGKLPTKPLVWLIFAAMVALVALVGWVLLSLFRSIYPERMSRFDKRYWKMWAIVIGLSFPIGIAVGVLGLSDQSGGFSLLLSNAPISPPTAILVSVVGSILMIATLVIYFRAIDDHEERAYLWGSNVAFHFLALAFPFYWLLARGGLVPALTIGAALLIVLLSCIVQAIVWALFKFR
ncbi:MAG: hypothetical protein V4696_12990 [Pseudomonadota bacterium]